MYLAFKDKEKMRWWSCGYRSLRAVRSIGVRHRINDRTGLD